MIAPVQISPNSPPVYPLGYEDNRWVCPRTGIPLPKRPVDNVALRLRIWEESSRRKQMMWMGACKESYLLWMNLFYWSYSPKFVCEDGRERAASTTYTIDGVRYRTPPADVPVITWPSQDACLEHVDDVAHNGGKLLLDKGRDMGATVICMGYFTWALLFWDRFACMVASRKESLVDGNTEDSLLGKVDAALKKLPTWMYSPESMDNTHLLRHYQKTNSRLVGESANTDIGQSLRAQLVFIDEANRFPYQQALTKSIDTVAAGTIFCSSPNGPGTVGAKLKEKSQKLNESDGLKVFTLGYWDHPRKGQGRTWTIDVDGDVTGSPGLGYWETPTFARARITAVLKKDIRENWLIDHQTSGMLVLDIGPLKQQQAVARKPDAVGTLFVEGMYDGEGLLRLKTDGIANATKTFKPDPKGRLKLWLNLVNGEPPRDRNYVQAWDFSQGVEGSNTVCEIMDRETGQIVAELASPVLGPEDAAPLAVALGTWFGGQLGWSFVIWERNGPGVTFGKVISDLGYPYLYHQRAMDTEGQKASIQIGWHSSGDNKQILFGDLNVALKNRTLHVPNEEAIVDMGAWIFDDHGRIVCGTHRDASTGAQARHGDRAIALGLCVMGRREAPRFVPEKPRYRDGTFGSITQRVQETRHKKSTNGWG